MGKEEERDEIGLGTINAAFVNARYRCNNPNAPEYRHYGGRGIQFRFDTFEQFLNEVGRKPSINHSLDRIENDGHYEPGNVRWATPSEQTRNRRLRVRATKKAKKKPRPEVAIR